MPKFSDDIVGEILSRLPVKSVCRFRCVSKSWLYLTKQPHFIKTHLYRTQKQKLILSSKSLFSLDHLAPIDDDLELDFPLKGHPDIDQVHLLGSCNGLVCIRPQPEAVFVLNPSTGESLRIPDYDHPQYFGYAPSIDDYMFVEVAYGCMVFLFSLKKNSWKRVQDFPYKHEVDEFGTFLNGAVQWICGPLGPEGPCAIAAFDLAEEKFSDLATPDSCMGCINFTTGVLGGCLCLLHQQLGRQHSFWVMKEYNVKESWTKILISDSYFMLEPLCYWKDAKILLVRDRKQLLLCNPKDETCKNLLANGLPIPCDAAVYLESLVPPNSWQN